MNCPECDTTCVELTKRDEETGATERWAYECPYCEWMEILDGGWVDEDADGRLR